MRTVHKYKVPFDSSSPKKQGQVKISLPTNASVLSMQADNMDTLRIWALVNTDDEVVDRDFLLLATGELVPDTITRLGYISTAQIETGGLVYHLFEILDQTNVGRRLAHSTT